jgi:hypothetical protein
LQNQIDGGQPNKLTEAAVMLSCTKADGGHGAVVSGQNILSETVAVDKEPGGRSLHAHAVIAGLESFLFQVLGLHIKALFGQ